MALLKDLKRAQWVRMGCELVDMLKDPDRIQQVIEREESILLNHQRKAKFKKDAYELKEVYWERYDQIPPYYQTEEWLRERGFSPSKRCVAFLKTKNCQTIKLYDIHYAKRNIAGADLFFKGKIYTDEKEIPFLLQPLTYFQKHQLTPKPYPSAKLLVNGQFYVDYYQIPMTLNGSQRQMIQKYPWLATFKGDVYACYKKELPSHLKTKKELESAQLPIPQTATAYWYQGNYCTALYQVSHAEDPSERDTMTSANSTGVSSLPKPGNALAFKKGFLVKGEWVKNPERYLMLDTETTGKGEDDEIIQLALLNLKGEVVYNQYFKPTKSAMGAYHVHKISDEFLADKPRWTDCWAEIESILKDKVLLIQYAPFDTRLLNQTCSRYQLSSPYTFHYKDTVGYFRQTVKKGALKEVMAVLGIEYDETQLHNAVEDCLKTIEALNKTLQD